MRKVLIITIFGLICGFITNIAHPVTPEYLSTTLELNKKWFGYFYSAMSLGMLIFAPIWGSLGDVKSRKYTLILCLIGYGVGQIMFSQFSNPYLILFARFFAGTFSAGISVSMLSHISVCDDLDKSKALANYVAFMAVGSSVAYLFGGFLSNYLSARNVILSQGLICISSILYVPLLKIKDIKVDNKRSGVIKNLLNIRNLNKTMIILMVAIMFTAISHTILSKYTDAYIDDLGYSASDIGNYMFVAGIINLLVNVLVTPLVIKKVKIKYSMFTITALSAVLSLITYVADYSIIVMIYTTYMGYIFFKSMYEPIVVNDLSENPSAPKGVLLGTRQSFSALGQVVGPLVAGFLYDIRAVSVFYLSAGLLLLSAFMFLVYYSLEGKK